MLIVFIELLLGLILSVVFKDIEKNISSFFFKKFHFLLFTNITENRNNIHTSYIAKY